MSGRKGFAVGALVLASIGMAVGQDLDKAEKERDKKLAIGAAQAKQMLLLMDQDKSGKVSRQEFMAFMEAEFNRLDVNRDGELDVKELTQSKVHVHTASRR